MKTGGTVLRQGKQSEDRGTESEDRGNSLKTGYRV